MSTLCVIGCGAMGGSLIQNLPLQAAWSQIVIADKAPNALPAPHFQTVCWHSAALCAAGYKKPVDVLLLAIKPQTIVDIAETLQTLCGENTLVVSIMAGVSTAKLRQLFIKPMNIVRTMPNLAGTCAVFGEEWSMEIRAKLKDIFGEKIHYVPHEDLSHVVTAVSGSGMAYFLYLTECLAHAAVQSGMNAEQAIFWARQTLHDAAYFSGQHNTEDVAILRQRITSKGGTTQAAVTILEQTLPHTMEAAIKAAVQRSQSF